VEDSVKMGKPFAMGFFDVMLGADIDGIELVKRVFAIDAKISAVFVTAYHDRNVDSINQYLDEKNADRWDYINKPFTEGEIIQKARNVTAIWNLKELKEWQEAQLQEVQKVLLQNERSNTVAAVGRSVAHEFGNLLMQIVGHAELSLMKNEVTRMREALETILKASDTATNVLERFKKLAQGDETSKEFGLIQISQPIDEAIELMGFQFKKHSIKVKKEPYEAALLEANRHSLVQIFMNLFINAVHVMEEGGQIDIGVTKLDAEHIQIKVRDHGPGIPEEILPKVTEALFTTKGSKGSGLGLAICKEIIEIEHMGQLSISNHPQGGAEICIVLPTRQQES
jgi:signal transduction histidine kinase